MSARAATTHQHIQSHQYAMLMCLLHPQLWRLLLPGILKKGLNPRKCQTEAYENRHLTTKMKWPTTAAQCHAQPSKGKMSWGFPSSK